MHGDSIIKYKKPKTPRALGAFLLLVEDNHDIAELIVELFKGRVSCLRTVRSLGEAREMLRRALPDLIILDRWLPDGDGLDFWNQLRIERETSGMRVLFLTVRESTDGFLPDLRSESDDYMTKPFSPPELLARTEALLRNLA